MTAAPVGFTPSISKSLAAAPITAVAESFAPNYWLLEGGGYLLLEGGGKLLFESGGGIVITAPQSPGALSATAAPFGFGNVSLSCGTDNIGDRGAHS